MARAIGKFVRMAAGAPALRPASPPFEGFRKFLFSSCGEDKLHESSSFPNRSEFPSGVLFASESSEFVSRNRVSSVEETPATPFKQDARDFSTASNSFKPHSSVKSHEYEIHVTGRRISSKARAPTYVLSFCCNDVKSTERVMSGFVKMLKTDDDLILNSLRKSKNKKITILDFNNLGYTVELRDQTFEHTLDVTDAAKVTFTDKAEADLEGCKMMLLELKRRTMFNALLSTGAFAVCGALLFARF